MIAWFRGWVIARLLKSIAKELDKNKDGTVSPKEVNKALTDLVAPTVEAVCEKLNGKSGK